MSQQPATSRPPHRPLDAVLDVAATAALRAPSILNTQPWRWRIHDGVLELHGNADRQLTALDPDGRMLTISCGAALDHVLIALRTEGYRAEVRLLPDPADPDLLATVHPVESVAASAADFRRYQTTLRRRTDRRPFEPTPISEDDLAALGATADAQNVHLYLVEPAQLPALAAAAASAADAELGHAATRAELVRWTHRRPDAAVGLATNSTVPSSQRPVRLRPSAADEAGELDPGPGDDSGARYLILWGDQDGRRAWLSAGIALSAVLLTAAERGLATSPMTDLVEVTSTRLVLRRLLHWQGHPYAVIRVGVAGSDVGVPAAHREPHDALVEIDPPTILTRS
jgi:nitroreductase